MSSLLALSRLISRKLFLTVIFSNFTTLAPFNSPSSTSRSKLSSNEELLALEDGRRCVGDRKDDLRASALSKRSSVLGLRPADQNCSKKLTRSRSRPPRGVLGLPVSPVPPVPPPLGLSTLGGVGLPLGGVVHDIFGRLFLYFIVPRDPSIDTSRLSSSDLFSPSRPSFSGYSAT